MKSGKIYSRLNFWANILLSIGVLMLILLSYLIYQRYNPQNLSFNVSASEPASSTSSSGIKPVGIQINSINLSLLINPSEIVNNKWTASTNGISYLKTSPVPGSQGNSILYGHNWPNLLGNLKKVKPGDKITIIYEGNSSREFEVEFLAEVSPSETSILENSSDTRITLYTCTGFLDSKRLVAVAKLLSNEAMKQ